MFRAKTLDHAENLHQLQAQSGHLAVADLSLNNARRLVTRYGAAQQPQLSRFPGYITSFG